MPAGRPTAIKLNDPEVLKQAELFGKLVATRTEMADWFGCSLDTIDQYFEDDTEFSRIYKRASANTKASLRRKQLSKAEDGDSTLLIWLGKTVLKQKEESDFTFRGDKENPIYTADVTKTIAAIEARNNKLLQDSTGE